MSSVGYGVTMQECAVSVYGGLRGAVGLALGLTVRLDPKIDNVIGEKVLFHCAGIVILTVGYEGRAWQGAKIIVVLTYLHDCTPNSS